MACHRSITARLSLEPLQRLGELVGSGQPRVGMQAQQPRRAGDGDGGIELRATATRCAHDTSAMPAGDGSSVIARATIGDDELTTDTALRSQIIQQCRQRKRFVERGDEYRQCRLARPCVHRGNSQPLMPLLANMPAA